ncbi:MAG: molybdopterin-guanine dinucleotide biosynthesis protein A [Dongiaceae bacterium]
MRLTGLTAAALAATILLAAGQPRADEAHHAGYYYPTPTSTETYQARVQTLAEANRTRRIAFVTGVTQQLMAGKYEPSFAIFAKGDEADELIIVAFEEGEINTAYRARALLANLTALSRLTPFFRDNTIADQATFFDLCKLLGFTQVTVSDGDKFALQVKVE